MTQPGSPSPWSPPPADFVTALVKQTHRVRILRLLMIGVLVLLAAYLAWCAAVGSAYRQYLVMNSTSDLAACLYIAVLIAGLIGPSTWIRLTAAGAAAAVGPVMAQVLHWEVISIVKAGGFFPFDLTLYLNLHFAGLLATVGLTLLPVWLGLADGRLLQARAARAPQAVQSPRSPQATPPEEDRSDPLLGSADSPLQSALPTRIDIRRVIVFGIWTIFGLIYLAVFLSTFPAAVRTMSLANGLAVAVNGFLLAVAVAGLVAAAASSATWRLLSCGAAAGLTLALTVACFQGEIRSFTWHVDGGSIFLVGLLTFFGGATLMAVAAAHLEARRLPHLDATLDPFSEESWSTTPRPGWDQATPPTPPSSPPSTPPPPSPTDPPHR
ncbi:MAG: hypothetical protein ACREJ2_19105 [Planctomycetota bacterium]